MICIYLLLNIPHGAAADVSPGTAAGSMEVCVQPCGGRFLLRRARSGVHGSFSGEEKKHDTFVDVRRRHVFFFLIARQSF